MRENLRVYREGVCERERVWGNFGILLWRENCDLSRGAWLCGSWITPNYIFDLAINNTHLLSFTVLFSITVCLVPNKWPF